MAFTLESFRNTLRAQVPAESIGLLVAFSGGLDSSVLLHAVAALRNALPWPLRAIHVDHQLQPHSAAWIAHCECVARELDVEFEHRTVRVADDGGSGIEAAARDARYAALQSHLRSGETLLTAHHADDQAETLLLALMRGTGVRGLAAMPMRRPFGAGWHVRPLLGFRRAELAEWARERALSWLDDPTNTSERFARNYVRADILPRLESRWPAAVPHLRRAAERAAEAADLLDQLARSDARRCVLGRCIDLAELGGLLASRQRNVLRWWLREHGARAPSAAKLAALLSDVECAAEDRVPWVDVDEVRVFRHRRVLYAEPIALLAATPVELTWDLSHPIELGGLGQLRAIPGRGVGLALERLPPLLKVSFRVGGERIRLPGAPTHRTLKNLLQEADVLPWWRERIPLLYANDRLCAVADLWLDHDAIARDGEAGMQMVWEGRPSLFAVRLTG